MKGLKWIIIVVVVVIAVIVIYTVTRPPKIVRLDIGTLLDYTGPLKEFGPNIKNGCELAAKQLKEAGLEIKLFHEDSETSAIPGTNASKKLVEVNKVLAIVGSLASGVTIPVAESVTIPNGVVQISPASTSPLITVLPADKGKDFLYRTCPSDSLQGVIAGKLAIELGHKTASVLYVNNPYGQGLAEEYKKSFEEKRWFDLFHDFFSSGKYYFYSFPISNNTLFDDYSKFIIGFCGKLYPDGEMDLRQPGRAGGDLAAGDQGLVPGEPLGARQDEVGGAPGGYPAGHHAPVEYLWPVRPSGTAGGVRSLGGKGGEPGYRECLSGYGTCGHLCQFPIPERDDPQDCCLAAGPGKLSFLRGSPKRQRVSLPRKERALQ